MSDPTPAAPDPYPRLVTDEDMPRDWWALYDESTKHFIATSPNCVETLSGHAWSRAEMVGQVRAHAQRLASQQVAGAAPDPGGRTAREDERDSLSSRYVRRCTDCRQVRGMTSFRVQRGGGRSDTCQWCEQNAAADLEHRLESAIERRTRLLREIADLNREIAHMKAAVRVAERLARAS